jgi:hypothetical protein
MSERYGFALHPWTSVFGTFPTSQGLPKVGLWFWQDYPDRRPYIKKKNL